MKMLLKISSYINIPARFKSKYFVTTPIFYVNGLPHIGHLQSCLFADAFARINRCLGKDVIFSTGTDEHGLKVLQAAEKQKKSPHDYCKEVSPKFKKVCSESDVSLTNFIQTTDEKHKAVVQNFWRKLQDNGCIRKGPYEGWYNVQEEAFVPDSQVIEVKEGSTVKMVARETKLPVEKISEENYFFPLPKFKDDLEHWLKKDVIKPDCFAKDVKRQISDGLHDLSVSRPRSRLSWGIPVPDDDSQVIYVWLDALVNYLTIASLEGNNIWPADCHVIGKDILKFHAIYWPAFLIAAGYEPPNQIFCHSHWTVNYEKMSKSKGNVIDPQNLIKELDCDGFRYYMLRASVPTNDTNYDRDKMFERINDELANTLGNLLNRCGEKVNPKQVFPVFHHAAFALLGDSRATKLIKTTRELPGIVKQDFLEGNFYKGVDCIMNCLKLANAFITEQRPYNIVKKTDSESQEKLDTVLHIVLEVLRVSAVLLQPIVPTLSTRLLTRLSIPDSERQWSNLQCFRSFDHLPNPCEGNMLDTDPGPLYDRRKKDK